MNWIPRRRWTEFNRHRFRLVWTDHKRLARCTHTHARTHAHSMHAYTTYRRDATHTLLGHIAFDRVESTFTHVIPIHFPYHRLWVKFFSIQTFGEKISTDAVNSHCLNLATSLVRCMCEMGFSSPMLRSLREEAHTTTSCNISVIQNVS